MNGKKVALVTGISSGIGQATAALLARRGFRVFGTMRRPSETNGRFAYVEVVRLDVRDEESVRLCVQRVLDQAGRIDALVNNAGYTLIGSLEETSIEEAKELFETNFFGVLRVSQGVLPIMCEQRYGRIANVGSVVGFLPAPYQGIYGASKHALEGYSESLDHEVRQFGIRVSVIEPGFTRTNITQNSQTGVFASSLGWKPSRSEKSSEDYLTCKGVCLSRAETAAYGQDDGVRIGNHDTVGVPRTGWRDARDASASRDVVLNCPASDSAKPLAGRFGTGDEPKMRRKQ